MLSRLALSAHEFDAWLHENAGRLYIAILSWGLVFSIIGSLGKLGNAASGHSGLTALLVLVFQAALLINQLAQWHELRERRQVLKSRNAARPGDPTPSN
ncbi:MAG TPA: hypothetical protein VMB71_04560 [Acetobacteraceae bacterium]|nr:hypothetical protein [Acetobacteraceae bacterium]